MIKTRTRKIISDILARKGRTALVIISIMIGVFGVSTLVGLNDQVIGQLSADLDPDHVAMTHVYVTAPTGSISLEENRAVLAQLNDLPGVTDVEGQAVYPAIWRPAGAAADAEYTDSQIVAFTEPFGEIDLEGISRVVEGRYPVDGQNEIAVEQRFAEEYGVGVGDSLVFRQPGADDSAARAWQIVGIVFHPYFVISLNISTEGNIEPIDSIFATYNDAQAIAGFTGLSSIAARYVDTPTAHEDVSNFVQAVQTGTPYIAVWQFLDDPDDSFIIGQVQQITSVLNLLAALAMIVSAFLVTNVINSIVLEQKHQIGVMKSVGATRWDSMFIYGGMAVAYGLIGSILGVLLSLPAASWMAQELAPLALTYIADFRVSSAGVIIGLLMGVLVPLLASALPVFNGTRVSILDAMTDLGISSNWGKSRLSRFIGALPVPMTIRQALSNVAQKRGRLALTGLTLTLAAAVFMGVTAVFTSLGDTVESIFDTFNYEIVMTPRTAQDFDTTRDLILSASDQFETVYPGYGVSAVIEGYESTDPISEGSNSLFVSGVDPASPVIQFDLEAGTGWQDDPTRSGVIITQTLADNVGKSVGDTLVMRVGGAPREYEIIGVDSFSFDAVYMDWRELATFAGFTDDAGTPLPGRFFIDATGEPEAAAVDELIAELDALMLNNGVQAVFVNQPAEADTFAQQLNLFSLIFNLTSGIMAAVGAIGLLAALSMAVFERQKEIGVMRSIGASSGAIVTQFLVEGILVGIIAWAVAVPLSYLIGTALADQIGFGTFSFNYPPQVLVMGFVGILIIATVASIWPSLSAARKTVSDILRYQ